MNLRHIKLESRALALPLTLGLLPLAGDLRVFAEGVQTATAPGATNLAEPSFEELTSINVETVYGASKQEQKTTETPSSVSIVTQCDLQQYGHRALAVIARQAERLK